MTPAGSGATGATAGSGAAGAAGATGANGSQGGTGAAGSQLLAGTDGAAGANSNAGNNGLAATNGSAGNAAAAPKGNDGVAAANGAAGTDGSAGATGSPGLSGGIAGTGGVGGVGVIGVGNTKVINDGIIAGGLNWNGLVQANAIEFTGGGNDLEIWAGSNIQGNVIALGGIDTFALGGSVDSSFDVSQFGFPNQYQGFDLFEKRGSSLWTLTNTTNELTPWTLKGGTLSVSEEGNLGHLAGGITFDGGNLQITGTSFTTTARSLNILDGGGGIDIDHASNTFTLNQVITGTPTDGGLWKLGDGTLVLNGANTYTGITSAQEGTLVIGDTAWNGASVAGHGYVAPGATLAGHGRIAGDLFNDGGTVSPGYLGSYGSLTVGGNYSGQNGAVIAIKLDGSYGGVLTDQFVTGGSTHLTGTTLRLDKTIYALHCGEQARVIRTSGGVTGAVDLFDISQYSELMLFDNGTTNGYDGIVYGTGVDQGEGFDAIEGLNSNQQAIAGAVSDEVLDGSNTVDADTAFGSAAIEIISDCGNGDFLDSLSPEGYAGMSDYAQHATRNYTRSALNMPGFAVRPYTPAPVIDSAKGGADAKGGIPTPYPSQSVKETTIFAGFIDFDAETDSSSAGDYSIDGSGAIAGIRHRVNKITLGGFIGVDSGDIETTYIHADVDGLLFGAFASYHINDSTNTFVTGGITYGDFEYDGTRSTLFNGTSRFDGVDGESLDIYVEIQGDVYKTDRFRLTPSFGLHYIDSQVDGFTETGGVLPLTVMSMDNEALLAELELRAEYKVTDRFLVHGSVGYTHNFMDTDRDVDAKFVSGSTPFSVRANGFSEDILSLGIGATWYATDSLSFRAHYRAEFGSDQETSNIIGIGGSFSF